MRKLIYVPIIHSYEETAGPLFDSMGPFLEELEREIAGEIDALPLSEGLKEAKKKLAKVKVYEMWEDLKESVRKELNSTVTRYWQEVDRGLAEEKIEYHNALVFQDGFAIDLGEQKEYLSKWWRAEATEEEVFEAIYSGWPKSPNADYLRQLVKRGARLRKTEDQSLLDDHISYIVAGMGADSPGTITGEERAIMDRRDMYIAKRINEELSDGVAILFIGAAHDPVRYLDRGIDVKRIEPFDVSNAADDVFNRTAVARLETFEKDVNESLGFELGD